MMKFFPWFWLACAIGWWVLAFIRPEHQSQNFTNGALFAGLAVIGWEVNKRG